MNNVSPTSAWSEFATELNFLVNNFGATKNDSLKLFREIMDKVPLTLEELGTVLNFLVHNYGADNAESYKLFRNFWITNGANRNAEVIGIDWDTLLEKLGLATLDKNELLKLILSVKFSLAPDF